MPTWFDSAFGLNVPLLEKILRPVVVYLALLVFLRLFGKRELAQLNPFDLLVLLSLSNTVQNAIIGEDNSVTGGLVGAAALLGVNYGVGWLAFRYRGVETLLEGEPTVLVENGRINRKTAARELMTRMDLMTALHRQGFERLDEVERLTLEPGGAFFIKRRGRSTEEEQRLEILRRLDELKAQVQALSPGRAPNV
jgi:uncharacterized membrane protein YcaP (DUF421 family)